MIVLGLGRDIFKAVLLGVVSAVVTELADVLVERLVPDDDDEDYERKPKRRRKRKSRRQP